MNLEEMLSDQFVSFSKTIERIHTERTELKNEFSKKIRELSDEAKEAQKQFDDWRASLPKKAEG